MKKILLSVFILFCFISIHAQDEHYTLYDMVPLSVNPAYTGAFHGTFRAGGLFRDQAPSLGNVFITPVIYIDAPIMKGFRTYDWVGVGANIFQDQTGSLKRTKSAFLGSIAYHFGLGGVEPKKGKKGRKPTQFFTIGVQGGSVGVKFKGVDGVQNIFATEINGAGPSTDRSSIEGNSTSSFDLSAGVLYRAQLSRNMIFNVGFAYNHFIKPKKSILSGNNNVVFPPRLVGHLELTNRINSLLYVKPRIKYEKRSSNNEITVQTVAGILFNKEKNIDLEGGLGYRVGNALEFLFGLRYGPLKIGASFDLTLTDQADIDNRAGAFEIAIGYVAIIHKKPEPKPILMCPRL